jgi:hypothetical protein
MRRPSRAREIRSVAHRLHAARNRDVDIAERDALRREHHRAVDPHTLLMVSAATGYSARRSAPPVAPAPADPGRQHVAHNALFDGHRIDAGARDCLAHDTAPSCGAASVFSAEELS